MHPTEPVNRLMTAAVLSVDMSSPAGEVLRLFAAYPVHHLPVVNGTKVVGMLSSADLMKLDAFLPKHATRPLKFLNQRMRIETLMRKPPITVGETQSVQDAAQLMAAHGIHALPVTDAAENLIGIITTTDIMHAALYPERRGDTPEAGGVASESVPVRVSPTQMDKAVRSAAQAVSADQDADGIARALLHAHARLNVLENVLKCADRYVRAGQDEHVHAVLVKAIDQARRNEEPAAPVDP
jgi:CBS domain-containing protein